MIVGSGQLAKEFVMESLVDTVIFASGVSNSKCTSEAEFLRERRLLEDTIVSNQGKRIVYFSSCGLVENKNLEIPYYRHKKNMEALICQSTDNFFILRLPQLFGKLKNHPTLINYFWGKIVNQEKFHLNVAAHRYVVDISDVRTVVMALLNLRKPSLILDVANPYRYSITEILSILERIANKNAIYDEVFREDGYVLDLTSLEKVAIEADVDFKFGKNYLFNKLVMQVDNEIF